MRPPLEQEVVQRVEPTGRRLGCRREAEREAKQEEGQCVSHKHKKDKEILTTKVH